MGEVFSATIIMTVTFTLFYGMHLNVSLSNSPLMTWNIGFLILLFSQSTATILYVASLSTRSRLTTGTVKKAS